MGPLRSRRARRPEARAGGAAGAPARRARGRARLNNHVIQRLTLGHERHGPRWQLQLPCDGDPFSKARGLLVALGLPTLGLATAISVMTTYGPVVLARLTSSAATIGALIGGEGAFALVVPLLAGALSDRLPGSSLMKRMPFVFAGAPLVVAGLVLLPFAPDTTLAAGTILAFFVGYYLYYPPYRAMYADLLPRAFYARAQASQAILRGVGLGVALLAGGLLLSIGRPLPFLVAAAAIVATTVALLPVARLENSCPNPTLPYRSASVRDLLLRDGSMRSFAVANALWEFSFAGLKSFIVLYVVKGLGNSPSVASAVIAVVAVAYVVGAPIAGRLAERYGMLRVLTPAAAIYGAGLLVGFFPHTLWPLLVGLPFVALAGAILLTLPQALAFSLAPRGTEGAAAGLQDFSRGLGVVLGPIAVGGAVDAFRLDLSATHGYAAMWPVIGVPVLLSLFFLRRIDAERAS